MIVMNWRGLPFADDWTYNNGTLWILNPGTGGKEQLTFNPQPQN